MTLDPNLAPQMPSFKPHSVPTTDVWPVEGRPTRKRFDIDLIKGNEQRAESDNHQKEHLHSMLKYLKSFLVVNQTQSYWDQRQKHEK